MDTEDAYEPMDDPGQDLGSSYEELKNVQNNPSVYQGLEVAPPPPANRPPTVPNQQPSVERFQPTQMQPLHPQFQFQYNPNQGPQQLMAPMPYTVAPNQHGMHYPPQAAGFGPQQYPPPAGPITHQPQASITIAAAAGATGDNNVKLPRYALTMSVVVYIMFTALLCWIPGNVCLIPALITAIMAVHKADSKKYVIARQYAMASIILTTIFIITFPFMVAVLVVSSFFGGTCRPGVNPRPLYCS